MFDSIQITLGFLTRIPIKTRINSLEDIAKRIWLFPLVGAIIGILTVILSYGLKFLFPPLIMGFILLAFLLWITGAHHTDGLLDFGDGIMVHGDPAKKIAVMHDVNTGTGGVVLGLIVLGLTGLSLGSLENYIPLALFTAEISAKLAMVLACGMGPSANTPMIKPFIEMITKRAILKAIMLSFILLAGFHFIFHSFSFQIFSFLYLIIAFGFSCLIPTLFIVLTARKQFAGLTGDCLGALNEITRMSTLLVFIICIKFFIVL
jgi:adenosylcobinamide-GDP ribazoletransferase